MDWLGILSDATRTGLGINAAVYALAAVGLNLQFGYTGLWNFGQAGFLLVGAYGTAIAVNSWGLWLGWAVLVGRCVIGMRSERFGRRGWRCVGRGQRPGLTAG